MQIKKLFAGVCLLISVSLFAGTLPPDKKKATTVVNADSVKMGINYLKKRIQLSNEWQTDHPEILNSLIGLIHHAEDQNIDAVLTKISQFQETPDFRYINRSSDYVTDSLHIKGYCPYPAILEKMKKLDRAIWTGVDMNTIPLNENLKAGPDGKVPLIAEGDEESIIRRTHVQLPDSLKQINALPEGGQSANTMDRIKQRQQIRSQLLENARLKFNAQISKLNLDSAITAYRKYAVHIYSDSLQNQLKDSLKLQNRNVLVHFNDSIIRMVNDSINLYVKTLQRYALNDSIQMTLQSLKGKPVQLCLQNNRQNFSRMFIRNEQNDSLGIKLMSIDKKTISLAIEDNVTFNRVSQKQRRDAEFQRIEVDRKIGSIKNRYNILTPWELGGTGSLGFTQTYLNNWKAGGNSAFALLTVLKATANYSKGKVKWENSGEFRNGWIRQGGSVQQTQKNDDKFELISRIGLSAFKKWYYSTEIDFVTQFFNGYNYPDKSTPISGFMSPTKTTFKLGFDYKPNNNISLFLSPISVKNVFVLNKDIDQTTYGIDSDKHSFWQPGFEADFAYKQNLTKLVSYETKLKTFFNYNAPLKKVDINWENTLTAQLTNRINMTFNWYMLYDDNVTFATGRYDSDGNQIYKPKWQTKELMTIGFTYKINKKIYERKKIQ
jgi:hypothetical protein